MKTYKECPICANDSFTPFLSCKDYTVSKESFPIVNCNSCGFAFTNPIPEEKSIGSYYESEEYISHSNTSKGLINWLYQRVRNYTLQQKINILKSLSNEKTLLDIGCGTGEFLNAAQSKAYEVQGIEPSKLAREQAIKNYGLKVAEENALDELTPSSFSFISMWHVLEHVYHLNDRIKQISRLLKQDGYLIVAVPNRTSYDAKVYQQHWAAYDVPRHLYHFSPNDIENVFSKHGFELVKTLPMKFDSFYVSMLSEKYKSGKNNFIAAFFTGLKSNLKAGNKNQYSSQIYILKKQAL
jgi:2-polyprenyl-3-methyl-5-hydroxy-6-metoxy-1,4-benzoquinol methylase